MRNKPSFNSLWRDTLFDPVMYILGICLLCSSAFYVFLFYLSDSPGELIIIFMLTALAAFYALTLSVVSSKMVVCCDWHMRYRYRRNATILLIVAAMFTVCHFIVLVLIAEDKATPMAIFYVIINIAGLMGGFRKTEW